MTARTNIRKVIFSLTDLKEHLLDKVKDEVMEETKKLINEGFTSQTDPYGIPWPPKKVPIEFDPKHSLENSFRWEKTQRGILIWSTLDFAIYHQLGTNKLPRRRMIPESKEGLPEKWEDRIFNAFRRVIRAKV